VLRHGLVKWGCLGRLRRVDGVRNPTVGLRRKQVVHVLGWCVCVCVRVVSEREKEEEEKWPSISRLASSLRMRSAVSAICARRLRRMWWRRLAGEFQPGRVGHQAE